MDETLNYSLMVRSLLPITLHVLESTSLFLVFDRSTPENIEVFKTLVALNLHNRFHCFKHLSMGQVLLLLHHHISPGE